MACCRLFAMSLPAAKSVNLLKYKNLFNLFNRNTDPNTWASVSKRISFQNQIHLDITNYNCDTKQELKSDLDYLTKESLDREIARIGRILLDYPKSYPGIDAYTFADNIFLRAFAKVGNIDYLQRIQKSHSIAPEALSIALEDASRNGHVEIVQFLLEDHRIDPAHADNFALRSASIYGHHQVVDLLLQDPRVDASALGNRALQSACQNGHVQVVRILLQNSRVDPSANDNWAVMDMRTLLAYFLLMAESMGLSLIDRDLTHHLSK